MSFPDNRGVHGVSAWQEREGTASAARQVVRIRRVMRVAGDRGMKEIVQSLPHAASAIKKAKPEAEAENALKKGAEMDRPFFTSRALFGHMVDGWFVINIRQGTINVIFASGLAENAHD